MPHENLALFQNQVSFSFQKEVCFCLFERSVFEKEPYFRGVLLQKLCRKDSKSVFLNKGHICRGAPLIKVFFTKKKPSQTDLFLKNGALL